MSVIGRLASGIVHELKNPLSIILSGFEFLEAKLSRANKETKESLARVKEAVLKADTLTKALLTFSKPARLKLEYSNINNLINKTLPLIEHQMSLADIKIEKNLSKDIPKVNVNKNQIQQVLINILLNSFEAMPQGGEIKIRTYTRGLEM